MTDPSAITISLSAWVEIVSGASLEVLNDAISEGGKDDSTMGRFWPFRGVDVDIGDKGDEAR